MYFLCHEGPTKINLMSQFLSTLREEHTLAYPSNILLLENIVSEYSSVCSTYCRVTFLLVWWFWTTLPGFWLVKYISSIIREKSWTIKTIRWINQDLQSKVYVAIIKIKSCFKQIDPEGELNPTVTKFLITL